MSIKVLVVIIVMGIVGNLLVFVPNPESAIERSMIAVGAILILPTVPLTLLVDRLFVKMGDAYSPGYSALVGTIVSAILWAIAVRRASRWFIARRSNQSLE